MAYDPLLFQGLPHMYMQRERHETKILKRLQPVFFMKTSWCELKTGSKKPVTQNKSLACLFKYSIKRSCIYWKVNCLSVKHSSNSSNIEINITYRCQAAVYIIIIIHHQQDNLIFLMLWNRFRHPNLQSDPAKPRQWK